MGEASPVPLLPDWRGLALYGTFITFEGVDGSGKSTQLKLLLRYLEERSIDFVFTREPGGTPRGEEIRDLLLNPGYGELDVLTEALLFAASRAEHVRKVIRPALEAGKVVICDRFVDSSYVYQGIVGGLGYSFVRYLNDMAMGNEFPDLTIVLDRPYDAGRTKQDRIDSKDADFHEKVREAYKELADMFPHRMRIVDASHSIDGVQADVRRLVDDLLAERN